MDHCDAEQARREKLHHPAPHGSIAEHPWGLCLYEPNRRLCFVLIPKNATTTFNFLTRDSDWYFANYFDIDNRVDRYIVILRDPVERLISATNMFLTTRERPKQLTLKPSEVYTEDEHYEKQHRFIHSIDHSRTDFFYHTPSVIADINQYYGLGFEQTPSYNRSMKLITGVNNRLVQSMYKEDMALIESVSFVNQR